MEWWLVPSLIVAVLTLLGVGAKIGFWARGIELRLRNVESRLGDVESRLGDVELIMGWLLYIHREELFKSYDRSSPPSSGSSAEEKRRLLAKLREGTITSEEATRLKPLLEKQREEASAAGRTGAVIAIGGLLLLLKVTLALAGERLEGA